MKSHLLAIALLAASTSLAGAAGQTVDVVLNEGCMCCHEWIAHMQAAGYTVNASELDYDAITARKTQLGIPEDAASCHTAVVGGYAIEGHVPAALVDRLLAEKPDAVGLAAPGMPLGSPGMGADADAEPFDVLLIGKDGATRVFATVEPDRG
ncbi:DUF411 domain-containing protein [Pleomorphomonas carboxyditropha]|uniref:Metal-binding protein n=1 Tax=Pleomorphomonas carboxyditropha TaxID=2023338 RepID=A0A2G9X185_9HYPH|nr:DUF411 domain-containing protein [Pleomorphomonas carboxyditropha]PIP00706.1 hypothetical protein CJ014_00965 [Pleomorphomonas carboxyditropha]